MNQDRFSNKVAIVTGGSSGIGKVIVEELCKEGASVGFSGRSQVGYEVEYEFRDKGYDVLFVMGDMGSEDACRNLVNKTVEKWRKINYLVNNAFPLIMKGIDATREDWDKVLSVGPMAYSRMLQLSLPYMEEEGGAVVNISSISAHIAQKNHWTYNASKGAVHQLTKCQALDCAKYKIRVNSISPGWIRSRATEKSAASKEGPSEKWFSIWGSYHMLGRLCEPIECARPVLFLLSDDASFITGVDLPVDGGYLALGPEGV